VKNQEMKTFSLHLKIKHKVPRKTCYVWFHLKVFIHTEGPAEFFRVFNYNTFSVYLKMNHKVPRKLVTSSLI
jgi:hypothetical protein